MRGGPSTALFAFALMGGATRAGAETLRDAIDLAYGSNPGLRAEKERARAADEGVAQARSGLLPTISLQGQGGLSETETKIGAAGVSSSAVGVPLNQDPESVSVQVVQPIFRGGRTLYGWKQATASAKAAHAAYRSAEQDFLLSVITVFMDVRRDEEALRIRERSEFGLTEALKAAQARFEVGDGTKTDVAQAQARLAEAQAGVAQARAQLDASRAMYVRIVGQASGSLEAPESAPEIAETLEVAEDWALAGNPDLAAARLSADAARYAIGVSRSQLAPQVDVVAQAGIQRENYAFGAGAITGRIKVESSSVLARVTIPLFDAGLVRSQVRQVMIERFRADDIERDTRNRVIEAVHVAWSRNLAAQAVEAASRAQAEAAEIAFEGVREEERAGLRAFVDVLDAERDLLEARLALANAERDEFIAGNNVLASYGGLTLASVGADSGQYNPEKYLRRARRTVFTTRVPKLRSSAEMK